MKPWSDSEIRYLLAHAPTRTNAEMHAAAHGRTPSGVEAVYRWALQPQHVIDRQPQRQTFARRVKRIAKELGWL